MKALALLIALALAACATAPPVQARPTAGLGEMAYSNGLRVRPLEVLEDSRCPINVRCIWAGRIMVRAEVIGGSWSQVHDLELGKAEQVADGTLTLIAVQPSTQAGTKIDPRTYRFTFDFQGGL